MVQTEVTTATTRAEGRICGNCVLWRVASNDPTKTTGRCFRFPPESPKGERIYPVTARTDWCGDHISAAEDTRGFATGGGRA